MVHWWRMNGRTDITQSIHSGGDTYVVVHRTYKYVTMDLFFSFFVCFFPTWGCVDLFFFAFWHFFLILTALAHCLSLSLTASLALALALLGYTEAVFLFVGFSILSLGLRGKCVKFVRAPFFLLLFIRRRVRSFLWRFCSTAGSFITCCCCCYWCCCYSILNLFSLFHHSIEQILLVLVALSVYWVGGSSSSSVSK